MQGGTKSVTSSKPFVTMAVELSLLPSLASFFSWSSMSPLLPNCPSQNPTIPFNLCNVVVADPIPLSLVCLLAFWALFHTTCVCSTLSVILSVINAYVTTVVNSLQIQKPTFIWYVNMRMVGFLSMHMMRYF